MRACGPAAVPAGPVTSGAAGDGLRHMALPYRSRAHYLREVRVFVRAALARDEPVMVAVPGPRAGQLRAALGAGAGGVAFADMEEIGGNPARVIPAVTDFADTHRGRRVSWVSEC